MKKQIIIIVAVLCLSLSTTVRAGEVAEGMAERAVRGVRNLVTGIVEVPMQTKKGYTNGVGFIKNKTGSKATGTVLGLFRGFAHTVGRITSGGIELLSFWAASPKDNNGIGIPLDAEYPWEEGVQYSLFDPSFAEGVKPIGRKFVRGLGNGLLGILELPSQVVIGADEGNVVKGFGKGVWYFFSRQAYGLSNVMTSFVPNPKDNLGVHLEQEWPWQGMSQ